MVSNDSPMGELTNAEKVVIILVGMGLVALASLNTPLKALLTFCSVVFWIGIGGMFTISLLPTELLPGKEEEPYSA